MTNGNKNASLIPSYLKKQEKYAHNDEERQKSRIRGMLRGLTETGELDEETAKRASEIQYAVSSAANARKGIPLELLITLRKKGLSYLSIAKIVGCSKFNVQGRLKGMDLEISMANEYAQNRAAILTIHQRRILNSISKGNLQKASLKDKAVSFGVLFDKEKIETGKLSGGGKLVVAITNFANGQVTRITDITDGIPVRAVESPSEEPSDQPR